MVKYVISISLILLMIACSSVKKQPVDYVDPFIGTGFHGHTYPGATVPFGAVQLSPDTRRGNWDACSGYHYSDTTILGFSHTHLSGTGCIDLGDILFHPTTKEVKAVKDGYTYEPLAFSHKEEKASPGYYEVNLQEEGIKAELTASTYVGMHRYTFPKDANAHIIIDMAHSLDNEHIYELYLRQTADNEITGMRKTGGWVDNQCVFFVAQFSKPFKLKGTDRQSVLTFDVTDGSPLICKVALSAVSGANAMKNMQEVKGFDFDQVHQTARNRWNDVLSSVVVEGGSDAEMTNFYTAMYHASVVPNVVSDLNGEYRTHDMRIDSVDTGKKQYSTFSLWDTFRGWHPLMTLLDTTLVNNTINSFLTIYDATGELPIWPLASGETGTMIGYHAVSVIADAYMKGIRGYDVEKAFEAMKASANKNKKGASSYIELGFIPSNSKKESVSCLLEFAYDDWCIAQMAKELGKMDDYETYINRSQSFINVFDGQTKFFRGKRADGNWDTPFDPAEVGRAYTEATAWQYRFFAPHDVNGLIQLFGGKQAFTDALDNLFTAEAVKGDLSDITGLIGQYAHGNEPSHHLAYLYSYIGQPWKTQERVRNLLQTMYQPTPEGIVGNEDCGQMSAWYILSSLGFYSVCPGSNQFVLTSPIFEKTTMKLGNGKELIITATNPASNKYIDKVMLNGKEILSNYITYEQLMQGGTLDFTLSAEPNKTRGTKPATAPYSYTNRNVASIPYVTKDADLFVNQIEIALYSATDGATIRYTLDGSEPTEQSPEYKHSFVITNTTEIKAKAYLDGYDASRTFRLKATKAVFRNALNGKPSANGVSYIYTEGNYSLVKDVENSPVVERGIMAEPSIKQAKKPDHFGYIFSGLINVPVEGVYEFYTQTDDGSKLYIDNELVVDNDTSHAAIVATGRIPLKKGFHSYRFLYFEDYEGESLNWGWKVPGTTDFTNIPAKSLYITK